MVDKNTALSWLRTAASAINQNYQSKNIVSLDYQDDSPEETKEEQKERRKAEAIRRMFRKETFGQEDEGYKRDYGESALSKNEFLQTVDSVNKHENLRAIDPDYKVGEGVFNTDSGLVNMFKKISYRMLHGFNEHTNNAKRVIGKNLVAPSVWLGDQFWRMGDTPSLSTYRKGAENAIEYRPFTTDYGYKQNWKNSLLAGLPLYSLPITSFPVTSGLMRAGAGLFKNKILKVLGGATGLGAGLYLHRSNPIDQAAAYYPGILRDTITKKQDTGYSDSFDKDDWTEVEEKDTWTNTLEEKTEPN